MRKQILKRLWIYSLGLALVWSLIMMAFLFWDAKVVKESTLSLAKREAEVHLQKDHSFRLWAARQGGVYIKYRAGSQSSPYLKHLKDEKITTDDGSQLILINPACMMSQLMESYSALFEISTRLTGTSPLNPQNTPDNWEKEALAKLKKGKKQVSEVVERDGHKFLRLIGSFVFNKNCLKCHIPSKGQENKSIGGISIILPLKPFTERQTRETKQLYMTNILSWFLGLLGIFLAHWGLNKSLSKGLEQENQVRLLLNSTAEAIYGLDTKGYCNFCNPACLKMVGYENEADLLGKNMHQLIHHTHPDGTNYQEKECPIFNAFKKGHSIHVVDEVFWRKNGTSFPVEYWSYPVRTEGKVVGAVVTFLDITMRKATEQALRESESKHRMLVQTMPDGLVMTNTKGAIIYANKSFCRMLGKQEKELAGHYLSNYLDPDSPAPPKPAPNEQPHELTWLTLDNSKITTLVSPGTIYDQEDKPTSHLLVVTDITQQKLIKEEKDKLSNQLRQVQKMEAIGTLAGGIAHDFNNILAAIIGYTEIALMDLPPNHKARSSLLESLKASKRARALVRQILSFSRQDQLLKKLLRLTPIIKEALKLMRSTLPSTIAIETNFKAKKDTILADSTQIHQVVMNLCTNAAHAMEPEGGKLTVTIEEIELDELMVKQSLKIPEGSYLCLSLSDTGKGMDKPLSQRIFDPFFTTKKQGRGVGMGLSVVHGIVSNHGGAITVYSEPGQGSLFRVYLPLVEMKQIKSSSKFPPHLKTGSEKILFVDDEPSVAQVGTAILNKLGYKVQTFSESLKALDAFKKAPYDFDLVITDQTMPEITGEQLAIEILQVRPEMPVLICTGFSEHITEKKLQKIGVKKLVFKPLNTREVAQVVRQVLDEPPKTTRPQTPQKNQVSNNQ